MNYNPSSKNDSIRNISTIISYPPGSIYELPEKTVMILGPDYWEKEKSNLPYKVIEDPRLSNFLGVNGFKEPPGLDLFENEEQTYYSIPARIFPDLQVCLTCNRLFSFKETKYILEELKFIKIRADLEIINGRLRRNNKPTIKFLLPSFVACPFCSPLLDINWNIQSDDFIKLIRSISQFCNKAVSFRWVNICLSGHINDLPLNYIVKHIENCRKDNYSFEIIKGSHDLNQQFIVCNGCHARVSMKAIRHVPLKCIGATPWMKKNTGSDCEESMIIAQKGDSMVCMPNVISSIQIPPYNFFDELSKIINTLDFESYLNKMNDEYIKLKSIASNSIQTDLKMDEIIDYMYSKLIGKSNLNKDDLIELLKLFVYKRFNIAIGIQSESEPEKEYRYRHKEFLLLCSGKNFPPINGKRILTIRSQADSEELKGSYFRDIVIADQLTITMTLETISRVNSKVFDNEDAEEIPIKSPSTTWLPAVEIKGEGIFIDFKNDLLNNWYDINSRYFKKIYKDKFQKESFINVSNPSGFAKFLLLHSFSHYFINRMSFVCGYNAASLRERIYFSEQSGSEMNAVLIMTSAGDSESSLGGLAYHGQIGQFLNIFNRAIDELKVCSNDPICGEQKPHDKKIIYAACYSCLLLPETSCEFNNNYLDRNCLVGDGDGINSVRGFFVINENKL